MSEWVEILGNRWYLLVILAVGPVVWLFKAEIKELILWIKDRRKRNNTSLVMAHIREAGLHGITLIEVQEQTHLKLQVLEPLHNELEAAERIFSWRKMVSENATI